MWPGKELAACQGFCSHGPDPGAELRPGPRLAQQHGEPALAHAQHQPSEPGPVDLVVPEVVLHPLGQDCGVQGRDIQGCSIQGLRSEGLILIS